MSEHKQEERRQADAHTQHQQQFSTRTVLDRCSIGYTKFLDCPLHAYPSKPAYSIPCDVWSHLMRTLVHANIELVLFLRKEKGGGWAEHKMMKHARRTAAFVTLGKQAC